jgi:hypothetical protein
MRVTTDLWAGGGGRRGFMDGGYAAILRRGAAEAGAAFVIVRDRQGMATLFGPAPQSSYEAGRPQERRFSELVTGVEMAKVDERLSKEARFDPDFWVVEVEPGATAVPELLLLTTP